MNKTYISIISGIAAMVGWGTSDFFASISTVKLGYFRTFFWSQTAGLLFLFLFVPFFRLNVDLPLIFMFFFFIESIFYSLAYLLFYKAFEIGNVSVVSATINLYAVITMLIAYIFLGQRLSQMQTAGSFLIIIGITMVSIKIEDLKKKRLNLSKGVKETILSALIFGIFWNISDILSENLGWFTTTFYTKLGAVILLLLFSLFMKKTISYPKSGLKNIIFITLVGILETIGVISVNFGLNTGDVILVTPIASSLSIVTITLAIIFLKERISRLQGLGIIATLTGIILTAF